MNNQDAKGYLYVETVKSFQTSDWIQRNACDHSLSFSANGWKAINLVLLRDDFIRIAAYDKEAQFNIKKNVEGGNNGTYQIGIPPSQTGTFLNIKRRDEDEESFVTKDSGKFPVRFICHSHSDKNAGVPFLRWRIALSELPNQDTTEAKDKE